MKVCNSWASARRGRPRSSHLFTAAQEITHIHHREYALICACFWIPRYDLAMISEGTAIACEALPIYAEPTPAGPRPQLSTARPCKPSCRESPEKGLVYIHCGFGFSPVQALQPTLTSSMCRLLQLTPEPPASARIAAISVIIASAFTKCSTFSWDEHLTREVIQRPVEAPLCCTRHRRRPQQHRTEAWKRGEKAFWASVL